MRHRLAHLILVTGISLFPPGARAQWKVDGIHICTAAIGPVNIYVPPTTVADGVGGAIVAWQDYRNGANNIDIYAQRVDALGFPQWTAGGAALCTAAGGQYSPKIALDGVGGAIMTWSDSRTGTEKIRAQRVDAFGSPLWTVNGVLLCNAANAQVHPLVISDGAGGAIVTWYDYRSGTSYDIYAQRVDSLGTPEWTANGVALSTAANDQSNSTIVSDGVGGAIVAWIDLRSGTTPNIYAERVSALGVPQWTASGVAVCTTRAGQDPPAIVSDGAGGAIVTWPDYRSEHNADIYAQRVNALGVPQWTVDGVALCTDVDHQDIAGIATDAAGGAIVTWHDYRDAKAVIYVQRVNAFGAPQWTFDGVALGSAGWSQFPTIVADGVGGAIVAWQDYPSGASWDIYAQRVNASGGSEWTADGVALCTAANSQGLPSIVSDGGEGAIATWYDNRNANTDIYAQRVTGTLNAVAITSFDATEADGVVTLRSAFRSDLGVEAVNVYRGVGTSDAPLATIERVDDVRGDGFEYVDRDVAPGQTYRYQIGVIDADGEFFSPVVTVSVDAITGALSQNQPNPFNPTTTIRFVLPVREQVTLAIYDTNGHLVRTLVNEVEGYGAHEVTWDGRDDGGVAMGSGVYFYRLHAGKHSESKKMVLLK